MREWKVVFPRPIFLICLGVVTVQFGLLLLLVGSPQTGRPHEVPVTISAPTLVAQAVAKEANDLPGTPFDAAAASSAEQARADVAEGRAVAALVIDLRRTGDVIYLNPVRDGELNDAIQAQARAISESFGRTLVIQPVGATELGDRAPGLQDRVDNFTLATSVLGFLIVLVVSFARGPVARTAALGATRLAVVSAVALAIGYVLTTLDPTSVPVGAGRLAVLGALAIVLAAATTMALEALAGLAGLGLAATLFFVAATPLLLRTDPYLLPPPWPTLASWTQNGATHQAVFELAAFGPERATRPLLVMLAYLAAAVVTLIAARRAKGHAVSRAGVVRWRLRVAVVTVPVTALMLALTAAYPPRSAPTPDALVDKATRTTCLGIGDIGSVADLNRVTGELRGGPEFQGADVGAEVRLQDGRTLWVFGDTLRGADFAGQRFVRNSMLIVEPDCLQVVVPHDAGAVIPDREDGVGYWPMSLTVTRRPGFDLVSVAAQRVRTTGSGAFDFENLGPAIAVFVVRPGGTPQLISQRDLGPDDPDRGSPTWGAASVSSGGWIYFYGTANPGVDFVFGFSLRVARVRADDMLRERRWRYWDGLDWVAEEDRAVELIPAQGGVSQTLSVFEQGGRWYALSKRGDFLGSDLTIWTAPGPTGPFVAGEPVAQLPSDTARGELRYMPLAHPDLLPRPGTIVVSYSQNNTDVQSVQENPFLYRPRFLRVALPE